MKNRLTFVDISKFFGMFAIILAHTFAPNTSQICYTFMVPLFFFFSGYTYNLSGKKENIEFSKKIFYK